MQSLWSQIRLSLQIDRGGRRRRGKKTTPGLKGPGETEETFLIAFLNEPPLVPHRILVHDLLNLGIEWLIVSQRLPAEFT